MTRPPATGGGRTSRLGIALGIGAFLLLIGARTTSEWLERQSDDRDCVTLHFVNESGLSACFELDSDRFAEPVFAGGDYFSLSAPDYPWVSRPEFVHCVPIEGFGGPGEWLSIEGSRLGIRITLRDDEATERSTSLELRGGTHLECRVRADKTLDVRRGELGVLGVSWKPY